MTMKCDYAQELFSDYIMGETDRAITVSLENHLTECAPCREIVAGLRQVWTALDAMPVEEPPLYFHENLMHRLDAERAVAEEAASRKRALWDWRALFRPRALAYAAVALVVVLTGAGVAQQAGLNPFAGLLHRNQTIVAAPITLQTARAEWKPDASGSGALIVRLQAPPMPDGRINSLFCQVKVSGYKGVAAQSLISSDKPTDLTIALSEPPENAHLSVTLFPPDGDASQALTTQQVDIASPGAGTH
jgi:hypothetical protein